MVTKASSESKNKKKTSYYITKSDQAGDMGSWKRWAPDLRTFRNGSASKNIPKSSLPVAVFALLIWQAAVFPAFPLPQPHVQASQVSVQQHMQL